MSQQQSGKAGVASPARTEDDYAVEMEDVPATQPVPGAFAAEEPPPADELTHATSGRGTDDVGPARRSRRGRRQAAKSR